jgi:hypothetical protein
MEITPPPPPLFLKIVMQIYKTTGTMDVELMGLGFLVWSKAPIVDIFMCNGMTETLLYTK